MPTKTVTVWDTRFGHGGSKMQIPLPLTAHPGRFATLSLSLLALPIIMLSAFVDISFFHLVVQGGFDAPFTQLLLVAAALLFIGVLGIYLFVFSVIHIRDLLLPKPLLTISETGIRDLRLSSNEIKWSIIEKIDGRVLHARGLVLYFKPRCFPQIRRRFLHDLMRYQRLLPPDRAVVYLNAYLGPSINIEAVMILAKRAGVPFIQSKMSPIILD